MGYLSGNSGSIQFGSAETVDFENDTGWRSTDTKITNWTLTTSSALLDTTTLGAYDKTSIYGLRTTSGTLRLFYYTTPGSGVVEGNINNNSASYFIHSLQRASTDPSPSIAVKLRLYLNDQNYTGALNTRDYLDLEANLTSVSYGSNVGELVAVDVSFEATGPVNQVAL